MALGSVSASVLARAEQFPPEFNLSELPRGVGAVSRIGFMLDGEDIFGSFGTAISAAGDFNGDGFDDFIVGDEGLSFSRGEATLYLGREKGTFPMGSVRFVGENSRDRLSASVGAAGDINADGLDDIVLGAPGFDPDERSDAGQAQLVFGRRSFSDALRKIFFNGVNADDFAGGAVNGSGDVNGDGIPDLIIGAAGAGPDGRSEAGQTYVVFGPLSPGPGPGFTVDFELSDLLSENGGDGSIGFVLNGKDAAEKSGISVSIIGDINADGIDDLLVGTLSGISPGASDYSSRCYVVFGDDQTFPAEVELSSLYPANGGDGSAGFVLVGVRGDRFCERASSAGDVNADGINDFIVGARSAGTALRPAAGQSFVVFGSNSGFPAEIEALSLLQGDGTAGFVLMGAERGDVSGTSVSGAGDVDGDGIDDAIVGAPGVNGDGIVDVGAAYVVFGSDQGFDAQIDLARLSRANGGDGSIGMVLRGVDEDDQAGYAVGVAGDIDADGIDDFVVGAPVADIPNEPEAGASYLLLGQGIDSDGDNLSDPFDNCRTASNIDQRDTDQDGIGNRCDTDFDQNCTTNAIDLGILKAFFFLSGDFDTDLDGDNVTNIVDLGILRTQYFQPPGPSDVNNLCN